MVGTPERAGRLEDACHAGRDGRLVGEGALDESMISSLASPIDQFRHVVSGRAGL